jgi:hypothetical protein
MRRNEQQVILCRQLTAMCTILILRNREWTLPTRLAVAVEIRCLKNHVVLHDLERCHILMHSFNINALSDQERLLRYRFTREDVGFISLLIPWEFSLDEFGRMRTGRRRYCIDPVEATDIMLRRMATDSRWVDVQFEFEKYRACLTEIFYHTLELFHSSFKMFLSNIITGEQNFLSTSSITDIIFTCIIALSRCFCCCRSF